MELDKRLRIMKADMLTGLVVGLPAAALLRQPLSRFLNIPPHSTWEQVTGTKSKGALKNVVRGTLSKPVEIEGPHPDGGTMKLVLQVRCCKVIRHARHEDHVLTIC